MRRLFFAFISLICFLFSGPLHSEEYDVAEGPWGKLSYRMFYLEVPDELLKQIPAVSGRTIWRFPKAEVKDPVSLIRDTLKDPELMSQLFESMVSMETVDEFRILPDPKSVLAMSATQRIALYQLLGRWAENPFHQKPIMIDGGAEQHFSRNDISVQTKTLVQALSYRINNVTLFSDVPMLIHQCKDSAEEWAIRKALSRTRALTLWFRSPVSDSVAFTQYWSASGKNDGAFPMLHSICHLDALTEVEMYHFLPPLPKKHLYTFPSISAGVEGRFPGSWWTAAGFFDFEAGPATKSRARVLNLFKENSQRLSDGEELSFGDIIVFHNISTDRAIHACVHIVPNIVYEKKDSSITSPWVLTTFDRVKARLANVEELGVEYRRMRKSSLFHPILGLPSQ